MAEARRAEVKVLLNGKEVGLSRKIKTLSYTDNASGKTDEISLTLEDREAWIRDELTMQKGDDLDVSIYFINWTKSGTVKKYHCGNFTLDDITFSAPPKTCTMKGVSVPADDGFKSNAISKTWGNVTLKQIAEEMKTKYGMTDLYYWGAEPVIESVEQKEEPDSTFLSRICEEQGMFLKVYKKALVLFDKVQYEGRGITALFREGQMENYDFNDTLSGTYTGAKLSYTDAKKKKTISVSVGDGKRVLEINQKVSSEGEALRVAKAKVNAENEKATTLNFTAVGNPDIVATCNIEVEGMGRINGKYFVNSVTHNISGKHTMKIQAYRIFDRL